jgi:pimeloyl-ACP methyl ester carboxylesterase
VKRLFSWSSLLLWAGMLFGCFPRGDPSQPIPTASIAASQQPARRLVVVLPGRGDDLDALRRSGIAQAVQSAWPDADVVLTGLALGYYLEGVAEQRLHDEVIAPARAHGYAQVWLVGASLGGTGALMFDRAYPGEATGLVLLAPYLGDDAMVARIAQAGGVARWQAPPKAAAVTPGNFQQELWRHVQAVSGHPADARKLWLAYGRKDGFAAANALLGAALPPGHVLVREGGHDWDVWTPAARELLLRAGSPDRTPAPASANR